MRWDPGPPTCQCENIHCRLVLNLTGDELFNLVLYMERIYGHQAKYYVRSQLCPTPDDPGEVEVLRKNGYRVVADGPLNFAGDSA